ncbi:hypothetical protein L6164_001855 [Bauhinia variegata]|uniref:Uncharacterized protein n=1 Tax=Bauhinia variegata TaxID=167791 RepID=A0ACB9QAA6_BAUVA|nr:hypothetical protein L6164_001855 [Bauhinia variegata]
MASKLFLLFCRIISNAWRSLVQSTIRDHPEGNLTISTIRYFSARRDQNSPLLPISLNVFEMKTQTHPFHPNSPSNLSEKILGLALLMFQIVSPSGQLHVQNSYAGPPIVIAFVAALCGILLRKSYPRFVAIAEKFGCLSIAIWFFMNASVLAPASIVWPACAVSILAFIRSCFN